MEQFQQRKFSFKAWAKRLGVLGFLFFLLKGLFWLYIAYVAVK